MGEPSLRRPKRYLFQRADVRTQAHSKLKVITFALYSERPAEPSFNTLQT